MTTEEINRLDALAAAATPGPWRLGTAQDTCDVVLGGLAYGEEVCYYSNSRRAHENAAFIAEARAAVPALIAALREARGPAWVAVEFALPDSNEWVLVSTTDVNGHPVVREMCLNRRGLGNGICWVANGNTDYDVTHWMPLPAPPTT